MRVVAHIHPRCEKTGQEITNITSKDGKFNYEYTTTQNKGTYDIIITSQEADNYLYNAKHMSLKVT